jgi:hypothetical protein
MPFELGSWTPAHRVLERLKHARCLQVLERLYSFDEEVRVRIPLSRLLRNGLEHILIPLKVLRWAIQEHLKLHPPHVRVAFCILRCKQNISKGP